MKWLSNIYDPSRMDAERYVTVGFNETPEEAWSWHLKWLEGKIIGDPKETESYTVYELKKMGFVGVYVDNGN